MVSPVVRAVGAAIILDLAAQELQAKVMQVELLETQAHLMEPVAAVEQAQLVAIKLAAVMAETVGQVLVLR